MTRFFRTQHIAFVIFSLWISITAQSQSVYENALAINASSTEKSIVENSKNSAIISFTNSIDITAQNYFQLAGSTLNPYMIIENTRKNYSPQILEIEQQTAIYFGNNFIEYRHNGKSEVFQINNIDHFVTTSDKCLIRSKIEVQCETVKINKQKINVIDIFLDQNNHIAFISIGDTELYLRP